jgi:hypothetical protein
VCCTRNRSLSDIMTQPAENHSAIDQLISLWPVASTTLAGFGAWFTAQWHAKKTEQAKTLELVNALRERAHQTELELAQIRAVLSAATGLRFEQITLEMVQDMVHRKTLTLEELETFVLTMPRLMWFKKREAPGVFRMMQVSQVYADKYLGGKADTYKNKLDTDIWPVDIAAFFSKHDEEAYISGQVCEVVEPVRSPLTGVSGHFSGVKWSFQLGQDTYVCGLGVHNAEIMSA